MNKNRRLNAMEQGMELFNRYAHSLNVVIYSKITGLLDEIVLRQALDLVQKKHPRLNSHIEEDSNNLVFKTQKTDKIPLNVIYNSDSNYWQTLVTNELNRQIDSNKVLVRAILLKPDRGSNISYLLTTIHHAIIDAISGINLHSEILSYCQNIISTSKVPFVSPLPPLPSLEELIPNVPVAKPETKTTLRQPDTLPFEKYATHQERSCGFIHRQLDAQFTSQIIDRCKREKATVHGAICAAMMLALAENLEKEDKNFYFSCRSSVDMRRRVDPPVSAENIAMVVSALTSFHELTNKTRFWDLAREVTYQIKSRLTTPEIYQVILSYNKGAESLLKNPDQVSSSVFVTNVGKLNFNHDYNHLKLEEINYALSTTVMGSVFGVTASTFQGKMTLNFVFAKPLVGSVKIIALVSRMLFHLVTTSAKTITNYSCDY